MEWLAQFLPEQASTTGEQVDALFLFLLAMGIFFSGLIASLVVVFGIRYRRRSQADRPRPIEGSLALELTWTLVPLAIVTVVFVWIIVAAGELDFAVVTGWLVRLGTWPTHFQADEAADRQRVVADKFSFEPARILKR